MFIFSSDEDEDDDDDEEENRKEMQGFIADDDDEEEDAKSEKSEKSRHSGEDELDDEDLDLINENYDIRETKKQNRVQLGDSSDEDEPIRVSNFDFFQLPLKFIIIIIIKFGISETQPRR